jgi:hypothetical protein
MVVSKAGLAGRILRPCEHAWEGQRVSYLCTSNLYHICPWIGGHISERWVIVGALHGTCFPRSILPSPAQSALNHAAHHMKHVLRVLFSGRGGPGGPSTLPAKERQCGPALGWYPLRRAGLGGLIAWSGQPGFAQYAEGRTWTADAAEACISNQSPPQVARASLVRFESEFSDGGPPIS